jgi:hypothetical protein
MAKSFLNIENMVRGLRNNNPGNLIRTKNAWQGKIPYPQSKDQKFEQFTELRFGIRAMIKDLVNDINKGKNTVTKLINEYAPKTENNTAAYIQSVCKTIGVSPNDKITSINNGFLTLLVRAILKVELGGEHIKVTDSDINDALQILGDVSTSNLQVVISKTWKPLLPALIFLLVFF